MCDLRVVGHILNFPAILGSGSLWPTTQEVNYAYDPLPKKWRSNNNSSWIYIKHWFQHLIWWKVSFCMYKSFSMACWIKVNKELIISKTINFHYWHLSFKQFQCQKPVGVFFEKSKQTTESKQTADHIKILNFHSKHICFEQF